MGIETKEVNELLDGDSEIEALFGNSAKRSRRDRLPYPEKTVFKMFVGCLNDEADKLEFEQLLTKSFQCQNELIESGDLAMLTLDGTFDKEGCYHVVSRYAYLP